MKTPPVQSGSKRWVVLLAGFVLVVGFLLGRLIQVHGIVEGGIPPSPSLNGWPAQLGYRITESEEVAHTFFHAEKGLVELSRLYHSNGFYNEALQCYEALRRIQPRNAHWAYLEASILAAFGRTDEATPLYKKAAELDSHYIPTQVKLGDVLLKSAKPEEAAAAYRQAVKINPTNPYALLGLARIAVNHGDPLQARALLREALKEQPDFNRGLDLLVTVDERTGDQSEANALKPRISGREFTDIDDPWLDDLTEACYDPYRLSVAADVAKSYGKFSEALALLGRAIELAPSAGSYHRERGLIFLDRKDYTSARLDAEQATALAPEDPYAWIFRMRVFSALKDEEAAWRAVNEGLEHCPLSADLHLERGRRLAAAGHPSEAIAEFKEAHRLWPSEASPLVELANSYFAVNQPGDALDALKEALQRQPENPLTLTTLTAYEIGVGDKAAALGWWNRLRILPQVPPQVIAGVRQQFAQRFDESLP